MADIQFATFYLDQDLFGVNILLVREINRNLAITPVEHAPDFVSGLLNLRGQIVTVLDLGVRLGLPRRVMSPASRCIVLKTAAEMAGKHLDTGVTGQSSVDQTGLLVDGVGDMVSVEENQIEPPPANVGNVSDKYLVGVVKLEKQLVGVLDIGKILQV